MTLKPIQAATLKLPPKKRSKLAAALLSSLETEDSAELERLWIEEADRRYRAYHSGHDALASADEAIAAVGATLRR